MNAALPAGQTTAETMDRLGEEEAVRFGAEAPRYCCWVCAAGFTPLVTPSPYLATRSLYSSSLR